jgi:hypothetical protein
MFSRLTALLKTKIFTPYKAYKKEGFTVFDLQELTGGSGLFVSSLRPFFILSVVYLGYSMLVVKCQLQPDDYKQESKILWYFRSMLYEMYDVKLIQQ